MRNKKKTTKLQKQINDKFEKLGRIQEKMLSQKKMIAASLIKRYLGTKNHKRKSHAFYLSTSKNGKTKLEHVSKNKIELVKTQVMEWKKYQRDLMTWKKLTESIRQDLKQFGRIQTQSEQK